jgi:hypothetical protein
MDTLTTEYTDAKDSKRRMVLCGFSYLQTRRLISAAKVRSVLQKKEIKQLLTR